MHDGSFLYLLSLFPIPKVCLGFKKHLGSPLRQRVGFLGLFWAGPKTGLWWSLWVPPNSGYSMIPHLGIFPPWPCAAVWSRWDTSICSVSMYFSEPQTKGPFCEHKWQGQEPWQLQPCTRLQCQWPARFDRLPALSFCLVMSGVI